MQIKPVVGLDGYLVSSEGKVFSTSRRGSCYWDHPMREIAIYGSGGYARVTLARQGNSPRPFLVHVLVLEAFLGPRPIGKQAFWKDGNRFNNHVNNLEWVSRRKSRKSKQAKTGPQSGK